MLCAQPVMVNGARPSEESGHSDDAQMDTSPQPAGMGAAHGTVGGMAVATSVGAGGSAASIPMGGLPGRGRGSTNTGIPTFMKAVPGDGGQRVRPPRWSRMAFYKKRKKVLSLSFCYLISPLSLTLLCAHVCMYTCIHVLAQPHGKLFPEHSLLLAESCEL